MRHSYTILRSYEGVLTTEGRSLYYIKQINATLADLRARIAAVPDQVCVCARTGVIVCLRGLTHGNAQADPDVKALIADDKAELDRILTGG